MSDNHTVIDLVMADAYRREHYGVLFTSSTVHDVSGPGVHNRGYPHHIEVWENRPSKVTGADPVALVDPHGRPTTAAYSYLMKAQAIVISDPPAERDVEGPALTIGETIDLSANGYTLGLFVVTAGRLTDPVLVPEHLAARAAMAVVR